LETRLPGALLGLRSAARRTVLNAGYRSPIPCAGNGTSGTRLPGLIGRRCSTPRAHDVARAGWSGTSVGDPNRDMDARHHQRCSVEVDLLVIEEDVYLQNLGHRCLLDPAQEERVVNRDSPAFSCGPPVRAMEHSAP